MGTTPARPARPTCAGASVIRDGTEGSATSNSAGLFRGLQRESDLGSAVVGWLSQPPAHRHDFERQRAPQNLGGHPDDELAEVAPLQHSDESAWRVFETVDDVLAVANATRGDARTNLAQEVGIMFGGEVVVDEAAYGQPLRENLPHRHGEPIRTVARWDAVVLRNEPGDRNACKIVEQRQHGFPDGSADVLEVNVDAVWTGRGQSCRKIGDAMIDRGVEAKLVLHEGAFLRAAGDADGSRAGELGELSDE